MAQRHYLDQYGRNTSRILYHSPKRSSTGNTLESNKFNAFEIFTFIKNTPPRGRWVYRSNKDCSPIWVDHFLWQSFIIVVYRWPWWRHQMETFSALLVLCAGNSPVTGEFPSQRPVTRSFDVFFDLRLNKQLSKQSRCRWFETPSRPLLRHCNVIGLLWLPIWHAHTHAFANQEEFLDLLFKWHEILKHLKSKQYTSTAMVQTDKTISNNVYVYMHKMKTT